MTSYDEGLHVVDDRDDDGAAPDEERDGATAGQVDSDLESLRDEFVDAYNARDADAVRALVDDAVELPDTAGEGPDDLVAALENLWDRWPEAVLTRGFCDDVPCAIGWRPDGGAWTRAAIVTFDSNDGLLTVIEMPDDADALERATAEEPDGDEIDESWDD